MKKKNDEKLIIKADQIENFQLKKVNKRFVPLLINILASIAFFVMSLVLFINIRSYTYYAYRRNTIYIIAILIFAGCLCLAFAIIFLLLAASSRRKHDSRLFAIKATSKYKYVNSLAPEAVAPIAVEEDKSIYTPTIKRDSAKHYVSSFQSYFDYFNQFMESRGFKGGTLAEFLASTFYSRAILLKGECSGFLNSLSQFYGHPYIVIPFSEEKSIIDCGELDTISLIAEENSEDTVFVHIFDVKISSLFNFIEPIFKGIKSPTEKCSYFNEGIEKVLPKNIIFVMTFNDEQEIFDLNEDLSEYLVYIPMEYETCEVGDFLLPVDFSFSNCRSALQELKSSASALLSEDNWHRVDSIMDALVTKTDFSFNNKVYLRLENYSIILNCFLKDEFKTIDNVLSSSILITGLLHLGYELAKENNISKIIDNNLGAKASKSIEVVKHFLNLKRVKGVDKDE